MTVHLPIAAVDCALLVNGPRRLRDVPATRRAVRDMLKFAQRRREITMDRDPPDDDDYVAWVGTGKAPLAFAVFGLRSRDRVWLDLLFVLPERRRTGIGRALLAKVLGICLERGARRVMFGTLTDNEAMAGLARQFGFEVDSVTYGKQLRMTP